MVYQPRALDLAPFGVQSRHVCTSFMMELFSIANHRKSEILRAVNIT
jgi:hypothetical protein